MVDNTSPIDHHTGRAPLRRDDQQWILDYLVQQTGRTYHFQSESRGDLPRSVRSHAMISKHLAQKALRLEAIAAREAEAGHGQTALVYFFEAAATFGKAQHPIFDLNDEKRFLYEGLRRCYERVIELSPYRIERLNIAWDGSYVSGNLHLLPQIEGKAPLIFYIPGIDAVKEAYPHPLFNFAHHRGMHIFSFDGPGMAESNMRGIRLTADNYEEAAGSALDVLVKRPEIDPDRIVVYSNSFGSFWGARFAARDHRIKALVGTQASLCEKYIQTDLESPRWKQLLAFVTRAADEAELDRTMRAMTMDGRMAEIRCPTLFTVGEYDPRSPLHEIYRLFDQMIAPAELWVMVDQHHLLSLGINGANWAKPTHGVMVDWLQDRLDGVPIRFPGQVLWMKGEEGPYGPSTQPKRRWFD